MLGFKNNHVARRDVQKMEVTGKTIIKQTKVFVLPGRNGDNVVWFRAIRLAAGRDFVMFGYARLRFILVD